MARQRVMMVGLDGFEPSIADSLLSQGRLPVLQWLREQGATVPLDHGKAKRTGLAWEHVSTGLSPDDAGRWAAVDFDRDTYAVYQRPTNLLPFPVHLESKTLVFDPPYFDLARASAVTGLVGWGAHDPGVLALSRPGSLAREITARFGPYPAREWLYGFVWPSVERARAMACALVAALDQRAEIAKWLYGERLPDWELGYLVVSEYHSAVEALWHGVDSAHPLAELPSAEPARSGIEGVYIAGDRLIGRLIERFPDAIFAIFNLHGMGANDSDIASMALLPELLYRLTWSGPLARERRWPTTPTGYPLLDEAADWTRETQRGLPGQGLFHRAARQVAGQLRWFNPAMPRGASSLAWMPAERYRRYWPEMTAFALPSFYDGRIRINLRGRERCGKVGLEDYAAACHWIEAALRACRDPVSGRPVIREVDRNTRPVLTLDQSEADLTVIWNGAPVGFVHPELGSIGPLPYRRTGGHTGGHGIAYFSGPGIRAGSYDARSAFDVVPTVIEFLREQPVGVTSGTSMAALISGAVAPVERTANLGFERQRCE
jgi:hypothetical protein